MSLVKSGQIANCCAPNALMPLKEYLEDYAVQHGFGNIQHFSDDGYSGTNFNRPAFNSLLTEIEAGRVGTVIV